MTDKVAVITDSVANLPEQIVQEHKIHIVPIKLLIQGKVYRDGIDISISEAYKMFLMDPESFKTSPSSPGDYFKIYRKASEQARNILCITLSSMISTGYEMACAAKEKAKTELPETFIEVMDSKNVTAAEGFIALSAARVALTGKDFTEVIRVAEEVRDKVFFIAFLDTIRHVYRTGRIPKLASQIGSMLNIKPILMNSSLGTISFKGMARNRKSGINRLLEILRDKVGQSPVHIAVMHAYEPKEAEGLRDRISSEFNCVELFITEFSPVMGYATGTGTLGLAFYKD